MNSIEYLAIDSIRENPDNPRKTFRDLEELAEDIKRRGILQPVMVRPQNEDYQLIFGARRFRAAQLAGLEELPAIVREMSDEEVLETMIIENSKREDVHPLEEAVGFKALLDKAGYDIAALTAKVARSETYVYQRLKLLDLMDGIQDAFLEEKITAGHAILIARLQPKDQKTAYEACFDEYRKENGKPVLTGVRELAAWIERYIHLDLHAAPFSKTEGDLVRGAGACVSCPKRTGFVPQLFPDVAKKDTCTDRRCYEKKLQAHIACKKAEFKAKDSDLVEVTTEWYPDKKNGPLGHNSWRELKKKGQCKDTKKAIVVAGRENVGQVLEICTNPKCKTHHESSGYSYKPDPKEVERRKAEKLKTEKEKSVRARVLAEILGRIPGVLQREDFEMIAECLARGMNYDDAKQVCKLHSWEQKKGGYYEYQPIVDAIPNLAAIELNKLLVELCLTSAGYASDEDLETLQKAAGRYQVNIKAIAKAVSFEFDKKMKPAKAETKGKKAETTAAQPETKPKKRETKGRKSETKEFVCDRNQQCYGCENHDCPVNG